MWAGVLPPAPTGGLISPPYPYIYTSAALRRNGRRRGEKQEGKKWNGKCPQPELVDPPLRTSVLNVTK